MNESSPLNHFLKAKATGTDHKIDHSSLEEMKFEKILDKFTDKFTNEGPIKKPLSPSVHPPSFAPKQLLLELPLSKESSKELQKDQTQTKTAPRPTLLSKEIAETTSFTPSKKGPIQISLTPPNLPSSSLGPNNSGKNFTPSSKLPPSSVNNSLAISTDPLTYVENKYHHHIEESALPVNIRSDSRGQLGHLIDSKKTFDNFVVGPSNSMAHATMKAMATMPACGAIPGRYPCLYIHSGPGLGKTHLLHAAANYMAEHHPKLVLHLLSARDFMKEMVAAIQERQLHNFQKKYTTTIDILMIDDIHELKNKHGTQNEFFHLFNELYNRKKQLIFTSDKMPIEIEGIEDRIRTRLQWGLVIDIQRPDVETRMAILKNKASELDLFLPNEIFYTVAQSITNSIRELEGALIKISAYAEIMNAEIDHDSICELLKIRKYEEPLQQGESTFVGLEKVAKATANFFKMPLPDVRSKCRDKQFTHARHLAMYLSHKKIKATLSDIGLYYSGRDHTSVLHAIKKVQHSLKTDRDILKELTIIEDSLD